VTAAYLGVANAAASGIFKRGETLNLRWDNSAKGDANDDVATVVMGIAPSVVGTTTGTSTAPILVALHDDDGDGIWTGSIAVNTLAAQQGSAALSITVTDQSNNLTKIVDDTLIKVDNVVPTLLGVTRTEGATATDPVVFTLHFSEAVQGATLQTNLTAADAARLTITGQGTDSLIVNTPASLADQLSIQSGLGAATDLAGNLLAQGQHQLLQGTALSDALDIDAGSYSLLLGAGDDETVWVGSQAWINGGSGFDTLYLQEGDWAITNVKTDSQTGVRSLDLVRNQIDGTTGYPFNYRLISSDSITSPEQWTLQTIQREQTVTDPQTHLTSIEALTWGPGRSILLAPQAWLAQDQTLVLEGTPWADEFDIALEVNGDLRQVNRQIDMSSVIVGNMITSQGGGALPIGTSGFEQLSFTPEGMSGVEYVLAHRSDALGEQAIYLVNFDLMKDKLRFVFTEHVL
jgi:hypothetical protein